MKITDYCPRAAPFDSYLIGKNLVGLEVGTDVGAHAHAMLLHCSIEKLYLVDIWDNDYYRGYCQGRLDSAGFKHRVELFTCESHTAIKRFEVESLDFIYIDITHDYDTVRQSLYDWWPRLKKGGVLGYRNYASSNKDLSRAIEEFMKHAVPSAHYLQTAEIIFRK